MEEKIKAIVIALSENGLKSCLQNMDLKKVEVVAFFVDNGDSIDIQVDGQMIPGFSYGHLQEVFAATHDDDLFYMICGYRSHLREFGIINRVMRLLGNIDKKHICVMEALITRWPMAYKRALRGDLDYFATGISYMESGLSLKDVPFGKGVNLATSSQDIYYGLENAKRILPQNPAIRYVFIGITPYSFSYIMNESFSTIVLSGQYDLIWNSGEHKLPIFSLYKQSVIESNREVAGEYQPDTYLHDDMLTLEQLLNYDRELKDVIPSGNVEHIARNKQWLTEYIELCRKFGATPIGVILPMTEVLHNAYPVQALQEYREILQEFAVKNDFHIIDLWNMKTDLTWFYDLAHLNRKGAMLVTRQLVKEMQAMGLR